MKIYKFRVLSSENKDFVRDIEISDDKRFYDLHMGIQAACGYDFTQMTSFYLSNEDWEKLDEISMMAMDPENTEDDAPYFMKDVTLKELIKDTNQRLLYLFDFFSVRMMFIELVDEWELPSSDVDKNYPQCSLSEGEAPEMLVIDDTMDTENMFSETDDFDDFGDEFSEGFENIDDLDI